MLSIERGTWKDALPFIYWHHMDYAVLQEAITLLEGWSFPTTWTYNYVSKCKYMIISSKNSPTLPLNPLYLLRDPLQRVECYK